VTRSPDSLIPSVVRQPAPEKRDDKAFKCRQEGAANLRAATQVNAVSASSTPLVSLPTQLGSLPGASLCPRGEACHDSEYSENGAESPGRSIGRRHAEKVRQVTGETLFGPAEESPHGREAHKGETPKAQQRSQKGNRRCCSTEELRENRREGRAATFIKRTKQGKAAGLPPQGEAPSRPNRAKRKAPARLDNARKLQRTLYRVANQQPERRFTPLYDKVCWQDILREAWQRVKSNKRAAGV
jgi:hypothetical protein